MITILSWEIPTVLRYRLWYPSAAVYIVNAQILGPGLRVAFMKVAPPLRHAVNQGLYNINLTTSHFNMEVVAQLVEAGRRKDHGAKQRES